jgi:uncharacterized protein (DUF433 family)
MALEIAPRIVVQRTDWGSQPVVEGTDVSASLVLLQLADGHSQAQVAEGLGITLDDVRAVLTHGADAIDAYVPKRKRTSASASKPARRRKPAGRAAPRAVP